MIYLILATICSASIVLLFKISNSNRYVVSMMNYVIASCIAIYFIVTKNTLGVFEFSSDHSEIGGKFVISIGILTGIFFLLSFIFYQKSVYESGASLASMFGKLGILLPMIFSIVIWREYPTLFQWGGIFLALLAIIMVNIHPKVEQMSKRRMSYTLLLLFIFGGFGDFFNKIFQKYAPITLKPVFLLFVFGTAFMLSFTIILIQKIQVKKEALLIGAMVGVPNYFASFFLIEALRYKSATVVFPAYSAGSILIVIVVSRIFFGETLEKKDKIAVLITVLSLYLIQ
ncbi:EamA family transporter [Fusibacter ferrireducens]|uniref:EamA family transporter n=1 Tax=Fusibacter ferrireducens TaxID=2785058 RepID=A0ABR9ZWG3_9FIRM|nr:EamA family transporter [Fusibacter ferrireducens]MBF4694784.1 EamA family transporter [Fusibacter ferrireducens]